jgi:hypothetical protein
MEGAPVVIDVHASHKPSAAHRLRPAVILLALYAESLAGGVM